MGNTRGLSDSCQMCIAVIQGRVHAKRKLTGTYTRTKKKDKPTDSDSCTCKIVFHNGNLAIILFIATFIHVLVPACYACYAFPPGKGDPCEDMKCHYGAICVRTKDGLSARCQCQDVCYNFGDSLGSGPVCGTDGKEYANNCEMMRASCVGLTEIYVQYYGKCDPCEGFYCPGQQVCKQDSDRKPVCTCETTCPEDVSHVCGSDGQTYSNECMVRKQACSLGRDIVVIYQGKCKDNQGPCRGVSCSFDGECIVREGQTSCECPVCTMKPYDPVCGTDGISYENECYLRLENCKEQKAATTEHMGLCMSSGCDKDRSACKHYSICDRSEPIPRCVCPTGCASTTARVCGTDGVTYNSECEMRVASCKSQKSIIIASFGDCEDCNGIQCKYGSDCVSGKCVCPQICPTRYEPVCGTDGQTYRSECHLRKEACRHGTDIDIRRSGECVDVLESGSGEGSGEPECDVTTCFYGGTCQLNMDGVYECMCSFSCEAIRSPVCGTDGQTYGNQCELQAAACRLQIEIQVSSTDSCDDMAEVLCDGLPPLIDTMTGDPFTCAAAPDCPPGSYCHKQFGRCCSEAVLDSDLYIRDCTESVFGCCDDMVTMAPGPNKAGCPDQCQCKPIGSLSSTCDPSTRQCTCKPGVVGLRCDRCDNGYWGLQLIREENNSGCMPCNCHELGSRRKDCNQNTGRCTCKDSYDGHKCGRCRDTNLPAGDLGCDGGGPGSCAELPCGYGAECIHHDTAGPQCVCRIFCSALNFPADRYVCASNGVTYLSECSMRQDACAKQTEIYFRYMGPCKDSLTLGPTDGPYTTLSRKTPRHILPGQQRSSMTPRRTVITVKPPKPDFSKGEGRIDDRCLTGNTCYIPNSHCHLDICKCNQGFIPTYENTVCSKVKQSANRTQPSEEADTCTLNPCRHGGQCRLDDELGYRCLCGLGRTGVICRHKTSFTIPSFSGASYLTLASLGNISGNFYIDIAFRSFNADGTLLYASQHEDGTGQFVSLAISHSMLEFRYDTGNGPKEIIHPQRISRNTVHQVIAKKMGQSAMLIVDNKEPVAQVTITPSNRIDLSGRLFLGNLPQNFSFVQERVGVNLGFVGCVHSLTAGQTDMARMYNLHYPHPASHILGGLDVVPCDQNSCQELPCENGGTCIMVATDLYKCICQKEFTGSNCEASLTACANSQCHSSATCIVGGTGEATCHCPETREGQFCEYEKVPEIEVPEFHGDSYLVLPVSDNISEQTNIEIWLLTRDDNGMLVYASQYLGGGGDFIALNIVDLTVELRYDLGDGPVTLKSAGKLVAGRWHRVTVKRFRKSAELAIDDGPSVRGESQGTLTGLQLPGSILVGGFKDTFDVNPATGISKKFQGVIQRIYLNNRLLDDVVSSSLEQYHVTQYTGAPCNLNPCMNGGVCIPKLDTAECRCPQRYIGQLCEKVAENLETNLPVRFDGSTDLQYLNEITSGQEAQKTNKFQFKFRTHQTSGMLLFQGQGTTLTSDYLVVAVSAGYVELSYNLGKQGPDNPARVRSGVYVSDGEWHTVYVNRDHREGELQVDKETIVTVTSHAGATQLDTDGMLWLGGRGDLPVGMPVDYTRGFQGCLGYLFIQDKELHLYRHRNSVTSTMDFCH
ncbi:agrin-like isoform X1 [Mya arenaria]|uniref:agrin-like isoform X1 n=1 Tax=Mya arenaria TaxID=6604 RepID=UPI0022E2F1D7|nr:agrin-like isoform X1 [Mya arenaria]